MPKKGKAKSKNGQPDKACTVCKASIKGHNGPYGPVQCQNTGSNTSMTSSMDHCTQTASLHATPPSTYATLIGRPPTVLPVQRINLTKQVGQPSIAMIANNYPAQVVSNNNIMSNCIGAESVLLEKATVIHHPSVNVQADNSDHDIQNGMAATLQNMSCPVSQWNQMQEQLNIMQAQIASLTHQAPSLQPIYNSSNNLPQSTVLTVASQQPSLTLPYMPAVTTLIPGLRNTVGITDLSALCTVVGVQVHQ